MTAFNKNDLPSKIALLPVLPKATGPEENSAREAHLRQLTLQRIVGYGVEFGDALLIRALVEDGANWSEAANAVAERALALVEGAAAPSTSLTRATALRRAAACLRCAQIVDQSDNERRTAVYQRATGLFAESVSGDPRWRRIKIPHPKGELQGWSVKDPGTGEVPTVLLVGGMEGWADDHFEPAQILADRGLSVVVIDGPGQGITRMVNHHYLDHSFVDGYRAVIDYIVDSQHSAQPIGLWGNSMGGNFVMHVAAQDERVAACCNNGGGADLGYVGRNNWRLFEKMRTMCGPVDDDTARAVFASIVLNQSNLKLRCPVLIIHAGQDQLVPREDMTSIYTDAMSEDKTFYTFEDAEHCVYRHPSEKYAVIGDWFVDRLADANRRLTSA